MPSHYSSKSNEDKIKKAIKDGKITEKQASGLSEPLLLGIIKKKSGGGTKEVRHKLGKQTHKPGRPKSGSKVMVDK